MSQKLDDLVILITGLLSFFDLFLNAIHDQPPGTPKILPRDGLVPPPPPGDAYNKKRDEYKGFGDAYGFKNLDTALGASANVPSVMRTRPGAAPGGGGATRPSLGNIFGVPGG